MSYSGPQKSRPARRRWPLLLCLGAIVIVAAGWTGLWFSAAHRAQAEIAKWRQHERQAGRQQECASESIGGFPLRIELRCADASFELAGTPTLNLKLPFMRASVDLYDPRTVRGEFTGPLEISEPGNSSKYSAQWNRAEARVHGAPSAVDQASLVFDALSVRDSSSGNTLLRARRFEVDGRPASNSGAGSRSIEAVLRLGDATADKAIVAEKLQAAAAKPFDADLETIVNGLNDFTPKPWPVRLREWQSRGGQIEILKGRIAQEDVVAVGSGTLRLTARGGLDGNLQVTVVGIEKLLKLLDVERLMSEGQIGSTLSALDRLIPGLGGLARQNAAPGLVAALGQRTTLESKPAVAFPVRFADGTVFLGPFQVGQIPPLF
jgi:hypothetical protein